MLFVLVIVASLAAYASWRWFVREDVHAPAGGRERANAMRDVVQRHLRVGRAYLVVHRAIRRRDLGGIARAKDELAEAVRALRPEGDHDTGHGTLVVADEPRGDDDKSLE